MCEKPCHTPPSFRMTASCRFSSVGIRFQGKTQLRKSYFCYAKVNRGTLTLRLLVICQLDIERKRNFLEIDGAATHKAKRCGHLNRHLSKLKCQISNKLKSNVNLNTYFMFIFSMYVPKSA